MGPDWSLLPAELLEAITKKVTSLANYIRFRAVCHSWLSACSPRPSHLPLQLPWLMLPYQSYGKGSEDTARLFYDLSTSKIHKIDLPQTRSVSICGSSHGWLVLYQKGKGQVMSLLNPITHATVSLPPFTGSPSTIGIAPLDAFDADHFFDNWEPDRYAINPTDYVGVYKAILTSSPLDPSCMVFVFTNSIWQLAFCKIGDECWTVIELKCNMRYGDTWDITYNNGFLYTVGRYGPIIMYNLNNPSRTILFGGRIDLIKLHLVDGVSGDILLINEVWKETEYIVYKLSNDEEPKCTQVMDVGHNVLFVDGDYRAMRAFSLPSANLQLPGWGANCLCYDSIRTEKLSWQDTLYNHNIKLARLDDGTVIDVTGDLGSFQVNGHWQKSLWLTPSLL